MRNSRRALISLAFGCTLGFAVNAAAQTETQGANKPATQGANKPATGSSGQAAVPVAMEEQMITVPVTVESVDKKMRTLTVKGPDGEKVSVVAPPDLENFDKLKKGDKIEIDYRRALAVSVLPAAAGAAPGMQTRTTTTQTAGAAGAGRQTTMQSEVVSVNKKDYSIKVKGPNGTHTRTVAVTDPELQKQVQNLKPGDVVQITYTEAMLARIRPHQK